MAGNGLIIVVTYVHVLNGLVQLAVQLAGASMTLCGRLMFGLA